MMKHILDRLNGNPHPNAYTVYDRWLEMRDHYGEAAKGGLSQAQICRYLRDDCTAFRRFNGNVDSSIGSTLRFLERRGLIAQVGKRRRSGPVYVMRITPSMWLQER